MITEADIQWISKYYPTLKINKEYTEVQGVFDFKAAYDRVSSSFRWFLDPDQSVSGEILENAYNVIITKASDQDELPSLQVTDENIKKIVDRHFYPDGTACLCGPVEKKNFILSGFSFIKYLERMVVPFLYAQTYYDKYYEWPWGEYAHGSAGVFQSYVNSNWTPEDIEACLKQLRKDPNWKRIKSVLAGQERVTETSRCFCAKPGQIKRCHPGAWFAMVKFRFAIKEQGIRLNG